MYRIMIVEDDAIIARIVGKELEGWGYEVVRVHDFFQVMETFDATNPQLVILDLSLPHRSGFHWCAEIRKISKVPIMFISSAADNMNMLTALHQGADDFVAKPFDLPVLTAKVHALLRRTYDFATADETISLRGATLDIKAMTLSHNNEKIDLTKNEFRILDLLLKNRGKVVSRDEIMRTLWEDESFIDDNTLTVNINRLRKKLESIGLSDAIATKKGQGYKIVPEEV